MTGDGDEAPFASVWSDLQGVAFDQGYADAAGIRTRYLHAGAADKPGLVFLHGTGGHAEAYTRNLGAHAPHFNTYAIDLLGHGFTEKPDYDYEISRYIAHLLGFIDAVGIGRVSLSGESLGGWIAGAFAVAHPDRVDRLVLNTAGAEKVSPKALEVARANAEDHGVADRVGWVQGDLLEAVPRGQCFDFIVSNPPYVDAHDMDSLPQEFRHEPSLGLAGGADGLDVVSSLLEHAAEHLNADGVLIVEVGASRAALVARYPHLPFVWLEFARGGDGVFLLRAGDL